MMKKILWWARQVIEVYLAVFSFGAMLITFLIQIFFRYVVDNPLTWPFELTTVTFVWTVILGATYAMRRRDHLVFTLLYDRFSERTQLAIRLASNGIVCIGLIIVLYPSFEYISFMGQQSTAVLSIPFSVVYAPFLYFLLSSIVYLLSDLVRDVKILAARSAGSITPGEGPK